VRALTPLEAQGLVATLRETGIPLILESRRVAALRSLSRKKAADLLGVSVSWIRDNEHNFPGRWRAGDEIRIPMADLENYIASQRVQANP